MTLQKIAEGLTMLRRGQIADVNGLSSWANANDALPALFDMGGFYGIRTDGAILSASWDAKDVVCVEVDRRIRNLVLFQASQLHPSLAELRPTRAIADVDCEHCRGTGSLAFLGGDLANVMCYCGGLGWVPAPE